jgi:hypothetical protein
MTLADDALGDRVEDVAQPQRILGVAVLISCAGFLIWMLSAPSRRDWLDPANALFWAFVFSVPFFPLLALEFIADQLTKNRLADMLKPESGEHTDAVAARTILAFFDLVYTIPLLMTADGRRRRQELGRTDWSPLKALRWALLPSMIITVIATLVLTIVLSKVLGDGSKTTLVSGMITNIISDYLALFVIRGWLDRGGPGRQNPNRLTEALFFAVFAGVLLVISFTGVRLILFMTIDQLFNPFSAFGTSEAIHVANGAGSLGTWDQEVVQKMWQKMLDLHRPGILAASIVHLWLPAFAILAYMLRVLNRWLRDRELYDSYLRTYLGAHPIMTLGILAGLVACALTKLVLHTTFV